MQLSFVSVVLDGAWGECTSERRGLHLVGNVKSPVDAALDGAAARLWASVGDGALDACYGGVPSIVDFSGLELDLDDLSASVVDVGSNNEAFSAAVCAVVDGDDVPEDDIIRRAECHCCCRCSGGGGRGQR